MSQTDEFVVDFVDEDSEVATKVKPGWTVTNVNGETCTFANLNEVLMNEDPMTLTFQV